MARKTTLTRTLEAAAWREDIGNAIKAAALDTSLPPAKKRKRVLDLLKIIDDAGGDDEAGPADVDRLFDTPKDEIEMFKTEEALFGDNDRPHYHGPAHPAVKGKRWKGGLTVGDLLARIRG